MGRQSGTPGGRRPAHPGPTVLSVPAVRAAGWASGVDYGCSPMSANQEAVAGGSGPGSAGPDTADTRSRRRARHVPGLTACALCTGETLGDGDPLEGGQRVRLDRIAARGVARLTYVDCLDECERGDVVVARPSAAQRTNGVGPVWFERLAGDALTGELEEWLAGGGPGARPVPSALADRAIARTGEPEAAPEPHAQHDHHHEESEDTMSGTTVIDPVCGMSVDPATAAATAEHEGTTYYFCAKGCQKAFVADPGQFV